MPILSNFPTGGSGGGGLALAAVSDITTQVSSGKVYVKWTDPADLIVAESTLAAWGGTLLVRKAGSAPTSRRDGTVILDSKTRDAYKTSYFCDSGLTDGTTYYYKFFPYTTQNAYDVLGSTNTNDSDATSTTATNPVSGTLMAAFPSDLRAVMKPMTIYTDNTGGDSNTASYVTVSVDYLPLLAEFEIFGTRSYANSAEQNYQAQYAYYSAGNSKVKYRHSSTGSTAYWWGRSPYYYGSHSFCIVSTNGTANYDSAGNSYGLAPAFRV